MVKKPVDWWLLGPSRSPPELRPAWGGPWVPQEVLWTPAQPPWDTGLRLSPGPRLWDRAKGRQEASFQGWLFEKFYSFIQNCFSSICHRVEATCGGGGAGSPHTPPLWATMLWGHMRWPRKVAGTCFPSPSSERCLPADNREQMKEVALGASLVTQCLRILLPMQGTRVRALVREDPTCRGATKPMLHNYWARMPQLLKPTCLEPVLRDKRSHCNEKSTHRNKE